MLDHYTYTVSPYPSPYTESAIFQHAESFTALLVQLSAVEHATAAVEELSQRLITLKTRLSSRQTLFEALNKEVCFRRRKVEELAQGTARTAMLLASRGKHAIAEKLAERERRAEGATLRLKEEEQAITALQNEVESVSLDVSYCNNL